MPKQKELKVTHTMQKVAVDILGDLEMLLFTTAKTINIDEVVKVIKTYEKKYKLCKDPYTQMICTTKEYATNSDLLIKEIMMEQYGHCDGLE